MSELPVPLLASFQKPMRSPTAVAVAVFVFALLVIGSLVASLSAAIREQDRLTFEIEVSRALDAIRERIATTSSLIRGTAGLFRASEEVRADEFRRYVSGLDLRQRYPGILGIGFTRRIDADAVPELEASMRVSSHPDFHVWPDTPRDEYHSIVYLEPLGRRNAAAIGYDMFTEPVRRAAMIAARESGELVASGKVTLVQEIDPYKQAGFLMYLPIYADADAGRTGPDAPLRGFVYSPLRVDDLLTGTRGSGTKLIDYQLFDGTEPRPEALLRTTARETRYDQPRFVADRLVDVPGRTWLVRFNSTPALDARSLRWVVPWLALAALVASALLARLSWSQARARLSAEAAAEAQRQSALTLHREREWLTATLGSIGDAVIAVDAGQRVTWINPVAERLTGWPRGEALGQAMDDVIRTRPLDGGPAPDPGEPGRGEAMLRARDGTERPVDHNSAPIRDPSGAVSGAVIVLRDASERRRVEAELRANDRRKDEFLAMLAHELRNPLAPISAAARLLDVPSIDAAQVREVSAILARQVRHMTELVDDLLEVSRVTRGLVTLDMDVFDLRESIQDAVEQVRTFLASYRHVLDMRIEPAPLWVCGDRTRLTQVVANLVSNAAKYTPAGGRITVTAGRGANGVRLSVRDTGIGIGPDLLPHVFELFTQGERLLDRSQGGLGIGLALVRTIVDLHGGAVRAESTGQGEGSVFTIELPSAGPVQERAGPPPAPSGEDPGPFRIAVVDDNEDALRTIGLLLEMQGHQVRTFGDAEQALRAADEDPAEVYILDIGLPGMSGLELAQRLRVHPRAAGAMLLALSGYGQSADVQASRAAGIVEHLVKPVDPERLLHVLRRART